MSRYGSVTITSPASRLSRVVENAEAPVLEALTNAALSALPSGYVVVGLTLAGAGDGSTFTVTIEAGAAADVVGGFTSPPTVTCFQASDAETLELLRSEAGPSSGDFADTQVAGASQGRRFMTMVVRGALPGPGGSGPTGPTGAPSMATGPTGPTGASGSTGPTGSDFGSTGLPVQYPAVSSAAGHNHVRARPRFSYQFFADFDSSSAFGVSGGMYNGPPWGSTVVGTGSQAIETANTPTEIGVWGLHTGPSTNGGYGIHTWGAGAGAGGSWVFGTANLGEFEWRVASPTMSDGTNGFICVAGIYDTGASAPVNGFWVEWDANVSTHFFFCTKDGAAAVVRVDTGVVAGTAYHRLNWRIDGLIVICEIDGVDVAVGALPTTNPVGPAAHILKVSGAGTLDRKMLVDWHFTDYSFVGERSAAA